MVTRPCREEGDPGCEEDGDTDSEEESPHKVVPARPLSLRPSKAWERPARLRSVL